MTLTLSVVHIPASDQVVVLVGMFVTPASTAGGGSRSSVYTTHSKGQALMRGFLRLCARYINTLIRNNRATEIQEPQEYRKPGRKRARKQLSNKGTWYQRTNPICEVTQLLELLGSLHPSPLK